MLSINLTLAMHNKWLVLLFLHLLIQSIQAQMQTIIIIIVEHLIHHLLLLLNVNNVMMGTM